MLTENQQIGVGLIALGLGFFTFGVIFFFDTALIAIGNLLFLVGLLLCIGVSGAINLFTRRDRIRGSVCMLIGLLLVLFKYGIIGVIVEIFGFLNLFGNFIPLAINFMRTLPVVGDVLRVPFIAQLVDRIAGKRSAQSV